MPPCGRHHRDLLRRDIRLSGTPPCRLRWRALSLGTRAVQLLVTPPEAPRGRRLPLSAPALGQDHPGVHVSTQRHAPVGDQHLERGHVVASQRHASPIPSLSLLPVRFTISIVTHPHRRVDSFAPIHRAERSMLPAATSSRTRRTSTAGQNHDRRRARRGEPKHHYAKFIPNLTRQDGSALARVVGEQGVRTVRRTSDFTAMPSLTARR